MSHQASQTAAPPWWRRRFAVSLSFPLRASLGLSDVGLSDMRPIIVLGRTYSLTRVIRYTDSDSESGYSPFDSTKKFQDY